MRLMKLAMLVTFVFGSAASACNHKPYNEVLKSFEKAQSPGTAVLIAQGETVHCHTAIGLANIELDMPLSVDHVFEIGSITKLFTATAILLLEQDGKLSRTDDITRYISGIDSLKSTVTIEHLLTHTSGLVDTINTQAFLETRIQEPSNLSKVIDTFKNGHWQYKPGENVIYSNAGYSMLSHIIERVSGLSYIHYLQQRIFTPLFMARTQQATFDIVKNKATGYTFDGAKPRQHDFLDWRWAYGAGDLLSTASDLKIFYTALMNKKLLNETQLQKLLQPITLNDGTKIEGAYTFSISTHKGKTMYRMNGSTLGFSSHTIYIPHSQTFIAVLSNSDGVNGGSWVAPFEIGSRLLSVPLHFTVKE